MPLGRFQIVCDLGRGGFCPGLVDQAIIALREYHVQTKSQRLAGGLMMTVICSAWVGVVERHHGDVATDAD